MNVSAAARLGNAATCTVNSGPVLRAPAGAVGGVTAPVGDVVGADVDVGDVAGADGGRVDVGATGGGVTEFAALVVAAPVVGIPADPGTGRRPPEDVFAG